MSSDRVASQSSSARRVGPLAIRLAAALILLPALAAAQALPGLSSLRVAYNTRKATANPQGELKAQLDAVDKALVAATRAGEAGEARRQLAKGMALLAGDAWTPALDYRNSLVIRSERTIVDSSEPYAARLEQIYEPEIDLTPAISARVSLLRRAGAKPGASRAAAPPPMETVREFGRLDGVARDLRESPFPLELDLAAVPDGAYTLEAELFDGDTSLGAARLGLALHKGLDERLRALEAGAAAAPGTVRADIRYPGDFIRNVNRGRVGRGTFDTATELRAAEAVLAAVEKREDPYKGRTGSMERHYLLEGAGEVMPYRVHVPAAYRAATPTPLVIALHGLGGNEDSFFDAYDGAAVRLAEQHGFLLAAPLGYRVDGFYGAAMGGAPDAATRRRLELSEKDVLEVVRRMRDDYNVDPSRIYLIGHSMGAIGTWHLAAKYPDLWAAIGPFSGTGSPASVASMKGLPQIVVHGDADPTVNVAGSRNMVAEMKRLGVPVTYIEVPGGNHSNVVVPNMPKVFEFLAAQRRPRT
ncbi:MAG TPA: PHB depolymerase family esterase [Vicinamibacterales bacterium]|nr:PHB depolymerase family esterase [Vicinamibacterales bacterium]